MVATAPFGGLARVPDKPVDIALGKAFAVGPYEVVVAKVVYAPTLGRAVTPKPGNRLLILDAVVKNTSAFSDYSGTLTGNLHVSIGPIATPSPSVIAAEESNTVSIFNPGVAQRISIVYEVSGRWPGNTATITVTPLQFFAEDPLGLTDNTWRPSGGPGPTGTVPVERTR